MDDDKRPGFGVHGGRRLDGGIQQRPNRRLIERLRRVGAHRPPHEDRIERAQRAFLKVMRGSSVFRHPFLCTSMFCVV